MFILAAFLDNFWRHLNGQFSPWTIFGLVGNVMFTSRFVVQWYASEKLKQSVIPHNFWRLSMVGGAIQLVYALHLGAVPVILGAILPPVIAARNLMLIAKGKEPQPDATVATPARRKLSEKEYLAIERPAEFRSQYLDGETFLMPDATLRHTQMLGNLTVALHQQFRGKPGHTYSSQLRVRVDEGFYTYPDAMAVAAEPKLLDEHNDTILDPQVIVEVLSPCTEAFDRGEKARRYQEMESLTDYVLVSQQEMLLEHWSRRDRAEWTSTEHRNPTDRIRFESVAAEITLSDIYERVDFSTATPPGLR